MKSPAYNIFEESNRSKQRVKYIISVITCFVIVVGLLLQNAGISIHWDILAILVQPFSTRQL